MTIQNQQAFKDVIDQIAVVSLYIQEKEVARDEAIQRRREYWEQILAPLQTERKALLKEVERYAKANRKTLLGPAKRGETAKAWYGFRLGKLSLPKPRGKDWDALVALCRRLGMPRFVRVREEFDRAKALAEATDEQLASLGLKRVQAERFWVEAKDPGATKEKGAA